ncbi:hypothetical protein OFC87_41375, partial [Escherichia coli]|nr:hypothetical protein [Escherichia coli]
LPDIFEIEHFASFAKRAPIFGKDTFILLLISLQTEYNSAGLADFKSSEVKLASVMLALKMPSLNLASLLAFAASVVEL